MGRIVGLESTTPDVLPDCRTRAGTGAIKGPGGYWVPIYCGNCGTPGGVVPERHTTFAFWLCKRCEKHGEVAGHMMVPDEIFWEAVKQEQIAEFGRELTPGELEGIVAAGLTPLAALVREGR